VAETGLSVDAVLGGRLRLAQPARGHRAGDDALFLAAAVPAAAGERVLDAGAGVGTVALALAMRVPGLRVTALELDPALAALAAENARTNGLAAQVEAVAGDLAAPPAALRAQPFDRVVSNPPWRAAGRAQASPERTRALAHRESALPLEDWLACCLRRLRPGGFLHCVLPADRLDAAVGGLAGRAGALRLFPLWPGPGRPAARLLLEARKGARAAPVLLPGLIVHDVRGAYAAAAEAVLRDGAPLPFA